MTLILEDEGGEDEDSEEENETAQGSREEESNKSNKSGSEDEVRFCLQNGPLRMHLWHLCQTGIIIRTTEYILAFVPWGGGVTNPINLGEPTMTRRN